MQTLRRRLTKSEEGFTLIELMVVVLIIAILIAIAIPTFLGAQNRARDRGAQSDLRNALTAAKTLATDAAGLFEVDGTAISPTDMEDAEPSLDYAAASTADGTIGVLAAVDGSTITLEKVSDSGDVFGVTSNSDGEVQYCRGAAIGDCNDVATDAAGSWSSDPW